MTENEFILNDRIQKIKSINEMYDLENKSYISFSGGKDSTVLSYLIDEALPNNNIPRVFINTGIEYKATLEFVREMASKDNRFVIYTVGKNIKETLQKVGYPFKSKRHSQKVYEWRKGYRGRQSLMYFGELPGGFNPCPEKLKYQITDDCKLNISHFCCFEFKKKPAHQYMKENNKTITLTGMMRDEGGQRSTINCIVTDKDGTLQKFHPMAVCTTEWENWYIETRDIKLSKLYYPPYNFKRTGCKGCPFALDLQEELDLLSMFLPNEKKQCEYIWKEVYDEYRRIGYRLRKHKGLFD